MSCNTTTNTLIKTEVSTELSESEISCTPPGLIKMEVSTEISESEISCTPPGLIKMEVSTELSESEISCTPPGLKKSAENATQELLPQKSNQVYENSYRRFMEWRLTNNATSFSETVLIAYFAELSNTVKPSTLWGQFSMLKATLNIKHDINIGNYSKVLAYLKRKSNGYLPRKSKTLTKDQINQFIAEAPDEKYLMTKIALIFGIAGALRRDEMSKLELEDINDLGSALLIRIPDTKTKKPRTFTITEDDYMNLYRKYTALRPNNMNETRFFIKYQNGKCLRNVVGIHKLAGTAQDIAQYLKLSDSKLYTSDSLRRTSATLFVNAGADLTALKRHGGWQSSTTDESLSDKLETSKKNFNLNDNDNTMSCNTTTNTLIKTEVSTELSESEISCTPPGLIKMEVSTELSESEISCIPPGLKKSAENATQELLPQKSKEVYENSYRRFMEWRLTNKAISFSETVLIAYFAELSNTVKPSTLWGHYSMLKTTLNIKHDINIGIYSKVLAYLKRKSNGYLPKKSKTLTKEQINQFIAEAPDVKYLMTKIALIFGIAGALRRDEMSKIKLEDIDDLGSALLIRIPDTNTKKPRSFTITGDDYMNLYRKYTALRPNSMNETRFFIKYQNGKCHRNVVGIHKLAGTAQEIAQYLKLPNSELYTGHSLRRTSTTLFVNAGADLITLKKNVIPSCAPPIEFVNCSNCEPI